LLVGGAALLIWLLPRLFRAWQQSRYDATIAGEQERFEIVAPGHPAKDDATPRELIRALAVQERIGDDRGGKGWPTFELRCVWRDGELVWQFQGGHQMAVIAQHALGSLYPGTEIRRLPVRDAPVVASAIGRLSAPSHWPLGTSETIGGATLNHLATMLAADADGVEVRMRTVVRSIAPQRWHNALYPERKSKSIGAIAGEALLNMIFNRPYESAKPQTIELSDDEHEARRRKRAARNGFEVGLVLEVAGTDAASGRALLHRLKTFTSLLGDGLQAIDWRVRDGSVSQPPRFELGDWELAQLWYLPDAGFDQAGLPRHRPLVAPPPRISAGNGAELTIGESRDGPLRLPLDALARHMAVIGATGSGKSTLLMSLALGVLDTPVGATVIDPHGDLAADILASVPPRDADRVHVLRLGDRQHPRGFNFLERTDAGEPQLVASEFVALFHDLWPDYTGPKMQHYLRHALLTMLAQPKPQTVIELIRLLTDDAFRERYTHGLDDPMLVNFWRNEWPSGANRERDTSIKAVLNKLGAFVSYHSIRNVVGQGTSTIRPRRIMDAGDLLVVDLSRVGGDNARLFGAMLISRYYIDAVGRQGTPRESRRPHLLIVDEVPTFDTRALEKIHDEGRKFGLLLVTAAQSLSGLGVRLRHSVLTNAGVLALLSPGADDVQALRRLVAPLSPDDLLGMRQHEMVIRMTGPDGRAGVFGGMVCPPSPGDPRVAEALIRASDTRDARPLEQVEAEVRRRAGGSVQPPSDGGPRPGPADPK
ncbi:MAG: helicase HerA domain-containing protein, partial [Candidatus Limnocylindria bacterium]